MFQVDVDVEKNRLYLFLCNIKEKNEFGELVAETERLVRYLKQGFSCISDLRGFNFCDDDHNFMQSIQETLWDSGVKIVIRIIDEKSITSFSHEKKSVVWPGYKIKTAFSMDQAEEILSKIDL